MFDFMLVDFLLYTKVAAMLRCNDYSFIWVDYGGNNCGLF